MNPKLRAVLLSIAAITNTALGFSNFHHYHKSHHTLSMIAGVIAFAAAVAALLVLIVTIILMITIERAKENLDKVAKAVGAEYIAQTDDPSNPNFYYRLRTSTDEFLVGMYYITNARTAQSTCYYSCDRYGDGIPVPWPEVIATALLLLKNNPLVFHRWREHHNCPWITP